MNRFLRYTVFVFSVLLLLTLIAAAVFVKFYISPLAKDYVEKKGSEILGAPLRVEAISFAFFPSIRAIASGIEISLPASESKAKIRRLIIGADAGFLRIIRGRSLGGVTLEIESPVVEITKKTSADIEDEADSTAFGHQGLPLEGPLLARDLALDLRIRNGTVKVTSTNSEAVTNGSKEVTQIVLQKLELTLKSPSINSMQADFMISSSSTFSKGDFKLPLPFQFSGSTELNGHQIKLKNAKGELVGLSFTLAGNQNLSNSSGEWNLQAQIPELSKLPLPPTFLPMGDWSGKVGVNLKAISNANSKANSNAKPGGLNPDWEFSGRISLADLTGTTEIEKSGFQGKGKITGRAFVSFTAFIPSRGEPNYRVERADLAVDLTQMEVEKSGLMKKPQGTPLALALLCSGNEKALRIDQLSLTFAALQLRGNGFIQNAPGYNSELTLKVNKTYLQGFEQYFPPVSSSPLKGSLQIDALVKGDFSKPEELTVQLNPLLLENFEGQIDWNSDRNDQSISGTLQLDGRIRLETAGQDLKSADIRLDTDLSRLKIVMPKTLIKESGIPLQLNVQADQSDQNIDFRSATMTVGRSRLTLSGKIANPQRPSLNIKLSSSSLDLGELSQLIPKMSNFKLKGTAGGTLNVSGVYDFKNGIEKSPLQLTGDFRASLPELSFNALDTEQMDGEQEKALPHPQPLLPNWPIANTAFVKFDASIARIYYGENSINGLRLGANLNQGLLQGTASIQNIFGGNLKVPRFAMKVTESQPDVVFDTDFQDIDIQAAMAIVSKDWQELIKGRVTGKASVQMPHYTKADFIDLSKAQGSISAKNVFLSTLQIDNLINESLKKIPAFGPKGNERVSLRTGGISADLLANFRLDQKRIDLGRFFILTPEKNELQAQGTLGLDMSINIQGTAYLSNAPVGGSIKAANSDSSGRFVIPLKMKGSLLKPEVSFAEATITQILKNTAEFEAKKTAQNVQSKLQSEAQKQMNRFEEDLRKKGTEALKGLIGK